MDVVRVEIRIVHRSYAVTDLRDGFLQTDDIYRVGVVDDVCAIACEVYIRLLHAGLSLECPLHPRRARGTGHTFDRHLDLVRDGNAVPRSVLVRGAHRIGHLTPSVCPLDPTGTAFPSWSVALGETPSAFKAASSSRRAFTSSEVAPSESLLCL